MMGLINEMEDGKRRFGPGYFDLVVIDEAHRSVYQKYRAIFDYFDSCLVGLTATPKDEVDHNTYSLFELEDGVPTAAYNLDQAIAEGHLVPPRAMLVPLKFPSIGIRYDDLSEEEKDRWDEYEWSEDGDEAPDEVSADAVNKWLFNTDTVDKVLETLMAHGRKVAGGDRLGKTIIFAKNRAHAEFIYKRFNAHYPEYKGDFARIITYAEPYALTLIDKFSETESAPHIAISVDMLDTGIDVPDVVNLLFFKPVRSKTKFWQMVGRGTRLRPDLYGPGQDKEDFLIFDVCNNIEFFSADLKTGQGSSIEPIGQRLFKTRVEILGALADDDGVRKEFTDWLHTSVSGMNSDNFLVRPHRRLVEKFANGDAWSTVGEVERSELAEISGLPTAVQDNDEDAKRFDLLVLRTELAALQDEPGFGRMRDQIRHLASALLEQDNIPAVAKHLELIDAVAGEEWWADVTVAMLEQARRKLRSLIRLIEKKKRSVVYTDLVDELGEIADIAMPDIATVMDYERFRAKARHFLREHENHLALQRLRRNEPVTAQDLDELERMFVEEGIGKVDEIERAKGESEGLGLFIRSLVGLDRKAAQDAVAEFLGDTAMSSKQIEFVNLIVEQLTLKGAVSAASLYEPPFVDFAPSGPDQMFPSGKVDELIVVLDSVRANAVAV